MYLEPLLSIPSESANRLFTFGNTLFEIACVLSHLLFGALTTMKKRTDLSGVMVIYVAGALLAMLLQVLCGINPAAWLYYVSSFLSGFFMAIPYASMELVVMDVCNHFHVNHVLSLMSLNSQVAAALAGYPTSVLLKDGIGFERVPVFLSAILGTVLLCMILVRMAGRREDKEKVE